MAALWNAIKRMVKVPLEARMGRLDVRLAHQRHVASIPSVSQAIATLRARWPELDQLASDDDPVFILSAGWRSGSTLLQRLIMSDPKILMWGEPYANCDYLGSLSASLRIFRADYPTDEWFVERGLGTERGELSEQWIANLYPEPKDLVASHRALLNRLYAEPARGYGYARWGLKEVRYGIEHARYLRFLYPRSRILLLHRNPYHSWRSYRIWRSWYYRWPDQPIYTAQAFGSLWRDLTEGYLAGCEEVSGMLVRYEDLAAGKSDLPGLGRFAGLEIRPEVMERRVDGRGIKPDPVPAAEIRLLRREVGAVADRLGYTP